MERLTYKQNNRPKPEEPNLGLVFIQAIFAVTILYVIANLILGWN